MTNPFNPFPPKAPAAPFPVASVTFVPPAPPAPAWASVAPIPKAPVFAPPGTAIDKSTGEIMLDLDDKPYNEDQMLLDWHEAQEQLSLAKDYERDLRDKVVACFTDPNKLKGTERIELGNGYQLKTQKGITYNVKSFDEKVTLYAAVSDALTKIATLTHDEQGQPLNPAEGSRIAASLIKWSCDISVKVYDVLPDAYKAIINTVIETKTKAPSVEIVAPKGIEE